MAYPEDLLAGGEDVEVHEHPHWRTLVRPVLVLLAVVAAVGFLGAVVSGTTWASTGWVVLAVLGGAAVLRWTVVPVLRWRTTHFVLTTGRVLVREGILSRSGIDVPLDRVAGVQLRRSPLERLLGSGTLVIDAGSDEPLEFDDVPGVERVTAELHRLLGAGEPHPEVRAGQRPHREAW